MMKRRNMLRTGAAGLALAIASPWLAKASRAEEVFAVTHSDEEWRQLLTADQFGVLRKGGTERPFTSPLLHEERPGLYACAGCGQDAFSSVTKYDPHEGWPSFWKALDQAVATQSDTSFGMIRTEVHCSRCGGHLGHLFPDGPQPTGLRYCMDGLALTFKPAAA